MAFTKTPAPCGTRAAAKRHRRRGEAPCGDCRQAERDYERSLYVPSPRRKPRHGTISKYTLGCRCGACRESWAEYQRDWRRGRSRKRQRRNERAWKLRDDVVDFLELEGWATTHEIAERFGRNEGSVKRVLLRLRSEGVVESRVVELALTSNRATLDRRTEWRLA